VLEGAGYRVEVPDEPLCCGLTWISTGQLDTARRVLRRTVRRLAALAGGGTPLVGLEPSCLAVLRHDALALLGPDEPAAAAVARAASTLAELLAATPGWAPPELGGVSAVAQPHCHQHAVGGTSRSSRRCRIGCWPSPADSASDPPSTPAMKKPSPLGRKR
jgi:Fe-S oxidoreductase